MSTFDARSLAIGWLSTAIASGADSERPVLHRTVLVESYPRGVRLVATDSYILLRAWVPDAENEGEPEPLLDEVPVSTAIAIDSDGRAIGFFRYCLKLAARADEVGDRQEVRMALGVIEPDTAAPSFGGMESKWITLEAPDIEKVKLLCLQGEYPNWRTTIGTFDPQWTATVALAHDRLLQVQRLAKLHRAAIGWSFGGPDRPARIEVIDAELPVVGLVMPCRWDLARNAPRQESVAPADFEVPDDLSEMDGDE